ncbi:Casein kinase I isoform alpha [Taenia crassiceps]|uniref:Casein kinase I isoform alpha n=1 Tax=Taenia crassiceps TaxID=6207 RepID=A0ABR4QD81_9CEST
MITGLGHSNSTSNDGNSSSHNEFVVNQEWKLIKRIGSGSFGEIFLAVNKKTKVEAAAKLELIRSGLPIQLKTEYDLLKLLNNASGITKLYWFGRDGVQNLYTVLVMELLGPSLEDLHVYCDLKFSLKTVAMLADQMIKRIETVHKCGLVHRDLKPDNFAMGTGQNMNTVYIIDFGLSKFYIDPNTQEHYPFRDFRSLTGTARYCSINAHAGCEQSRRDDLESLGYVLVYLTKGHLPWQGLQAESKREKFRKIYKTKQSVKAEVLCEGLPEEFLKYINYCRSLAYEEEPKYRYLRSLFWKVMDKNGYKYDAQYDWIAPAST